MAHVLITGASSGIGAALAVEMARRGHDVGLVARRRDALDRVAEEVRSLGRRAVVAAADVTDRDAVRAAVARCEEELGPIDVAVANAGGGGKNPAAAFDALGATAVMRLNLDGALFLFEAVLPGMLARGRGHLVGVSSIAGHFGIPGAGVYSASKAALHRVLEAFAVELRSTGIAVTTVNPGFVDTPLVARNTNPMPFRWSADRAARVIATGIERRRRLVEFPLPLRLVAALGRRLPSPVVEWLLRFTRAK
jgi:short-subunit dehydrogenase